MKSAGASLRGNNRSTKPDFLLTRNGSGGILITKHPFGKEGLGMMLAQKIALDTHNAQDTSFRRAAGTARKAYRWA